MADAEKATRIGRLEPRFKFFLNPYSDARFTRCPECEKRMRTRKEPFVIHVDPKQLVVLNMTARYCPDCDLLILHRDKVEDLLARALETQAPDTIGNEYLIIGTLERTLWHKGRSQLTLGPAIEHLHDLKDMVRYQPAHYGWVPKEGDEGK